MTIDQLNNATSKFRGLPVEFVSLRDDLRFGRLPVGVVDAEPARRAKWNADEALANDETNSDLAWQVELATYALRRVQAHNANFAK